MPGFQIVKKKFFLIWIFLESCDSMWGCKAKAIPGRQLPNIKGKILANMVGLWGPCTDAAKSLHTVLPSYWLYRVRIKTDSLECQNITPQTEYGWTDFANQQVCHLS